MSAPANTSDRLRVLSLWQPWATLCVAPDPTSRHSTPPKRHETRSWQPRHPTPFGVAIHATKKMDGEIRAILKEQPFYDCLKRCGFLPQDPRGYMQRGIRVGSTGLRILPLGAIVGVATVSSVVATGSLQITSFEDVLLGDWSPGRFAWHLIDSVMLPEPIPFRGRQEALYELPADIERQVWEQLR